MPHWTDHTPRGRTAKPNRRGVATLDYALLLGILLPAVAVLIGAGSKIMQLVYEMLAVFLAWPFM